MKKVIRLTESDLVRIVKRVIKEDVLSYDIIPMKKEYIKSIRFLDSNGKDIMESYDLMGNTLTVKLKGVNFDTLESLQLRILFDKKLKVLPDVARGANYKTLDNPNGTAVVWDMSMGPDERLYHAMLKKGSSDYWCDIANISGGDLNIKVVPSPNSTAVWNTKK